MEWVDDGIVLGARLHGESSVILEALTRAHGRHLGLVRSGRSARMQPALQAGNGVRLTWRGRLDEHLGQYAVEPTEFRAARLIEQAAALHGLRHVAGLMRLLPEREPHEGLFEACAVVLDHLDQLELAGALVVRLELALLQELGFGLDLTSCAATGATQELIYVSPKSGRAVSASAGAPFAGRLLTLPAFARGLMPGDGVPASDIAAGLKLTGFFLTRHVYEPRGLGPGDDRAAFAAAVSGRSGW
jgi:DNA repair protein RecO (recombination protein O)